MSTFNAEKALSKLQDDLASTKESIENILNNVEGEGRDLNTEETKVIENLQEDFKEISAKIGVYETQRELTASMSIPKKRRTVPEVESEPVEETTMTKNVVRRSEGSSLRTGNIINSRTHAFPTFGSWAKAVISAGKGVGIDNRLRAVKAAQERYGGEGGYTVPPQFSSEILDVVLGDSVASLASRAWQMPVSGNTMSIPLSMDVPYGSGVRAFWAAEGQTHQRSTPNFEINQMYLQKLTVLIPITDELMSDASGLDSFLMRAASSAIAWEISKAMINGPANKGPAGIYDAPCLVTIAKESSQAADTIQKANIYKMMAALPAESYGSAVWLVSPTAQALLWDLLQTNRGDPGRGIADAPYETLLRRPVIPHMACRELGNKGDIILADFSKYMFLYKTSGMQTATSIHMMFDTDTTLMKVQIRCNGMATWSSAVSVPYGSHQISPFVMLAERA